LRSILLAALLALALPSAALADPPPGSDWKEAYFEGDGVTIHADVFRPKGMPETTKTPVILAIGPYFGHGGQSTPNGSEADYPSTRFTDMIEGGKVFERGYTVVYADLRGFGGSTGCNDFGGKGEQADVKAAVEWAASQPWSTGKVGMWGKSYDAWTEVMALATKPKGLAATVIQSPIIDGYRTLYQNGVHYDAGWYATPGLYQSIDAIPPVPSDSPDYFLAWAQGFNPACYAQNIANQNTTLDWDSPFWQERNLPGARGSNVPTFWSHGYLDANTKPDNFMDVWSKLTGPSRAWFGQYDHVRGNESGVVGREGFLDEAMRWFDRYLKDDKNAKVENDPRTEIQDNEGKWRGEAQWPPADAGLRVMPLKGGSVTDGPNNTAEGEATPDAPTGVGVWSISQPLQHDARMAGIPKINLDVSTVSPRAHMVALLYDVDFSAAEPTATLVSRAAYAPTSADSKIAFELYPEDWKFVAGHRVGVLLAGSDLDWYNPPHTGQSINITGGTIELPWLKFQRTAFLEGEQASAYTTGVHPIPFDTSVAESQSVLADLPPALVPAPVGTVKPGLTGPGAATPKAATLRLTRRLLKGRKLRIIVRGGGSLPIAITLKRGKATIAKKTLKPKRGVAQITLKLKKKGTYKLTAAAKGTGAPRAVTRTIRIR
jgi:predicted acyl esterase